MKYDTVHYRQSLDEANVKVLEQQKLVAENEKAGQSNVRNMA